MWKSHWKLTRDPFLDGSSAYVPLPAHDEAIARLVDAIETRQRLAVLRAGAGLGKSRVLSEVLRQVGTPSRRVAKIRSPIDGSALFAGLAESLGIRPPSGATRSAGWKALADAVRLCRWQRLRVVLAVDDCQDLRDEADRLDLGRLTHLDLHPEAALTVVQVVRTQPGDESDPLPWELAIRLAPLTRSETERYVAAKLAAAGRDEPTFTPRAIVQLHDLSEGNPSGLDRLGSLALMAGAMRGLEVITPDVVHGVSLECAGGPTLTQTGVRVGGVV